MKSGKKVSEILLSVLLMHLTELHLYFVDLFASLISLESENRYFGSHGTMGPKEISSDNKEKEAFCETALCSLKSSHTVTAFSSRSLSLRQFLWNWQRDIWKPIEGYGEKGNILR